MEAIELVKGPKNNSFTRLHSPKADDGTFGVIPMMPDGEGEVKESQNSDLSSASPVQDESNVERAAVKETRVDGGLVAWLQVLGAFCLFFTSW